MKALSSVPYEGVNPSAIDLQHRSDKVPKIDFNFHGYIRGAEINSVTDSGGNTLDVSGLSADRLAAGLEDGEFFISLSDYLLTSRKNEVTLEDFEEAR